MTTFLFSRLPIPHRIAGFALTATFFILVILALARHNLRGDIVDSSPSASSSSLLRSQSHFASSEQHNEEASVQFASTTESATGPGGEAPAEDDAPKSYYIFLQKFPLESSWIKVYHTEVIVCPRENFANDPAFLNMLDGSLKSLTPSQIDSTNIRSSVGDGVQNGFVAIEKDQWSKQSEPGCVQLGYGGANCSMGCCGSPHKHQNTNYALNSHQAVIGNAMTDHKELYFYGVSGSTAGGVDGISGEDAYKSVCHGHMNAIEMGGTLPKCVSNWAGQDYNPLTNNCNTFTSTVLKCVYGLSDAKPHLGVSDLITVKCPKEAKEDGAEVEQCLLPKMDKSFEVHSEEAIMLE